MKSLMFLSQFLRDMRSQKLRTFLTIFGITIGGKNFTKVISETVAMGMDNDCTAATAGSIVGAVVGKKGIPTRWYRPFHNKVKSYFYGNPVFKIDDLIQRFMKQAGRVADDR